MVDDLFLYSQLMTIIFNNNVITLDVLTTILDNRLVILNEVIRENKQLKLFDEDIYSLIERVLYISEDSKNLNL